METVNTIGPPDRFAESDYLKCLASKSTPQWRDELVSDGGVELDLHPILTVDHLLQPLETFQFPRELLQDLDALLFSLLIGYSSVDDEGLDDFKIVYVASLYLHCHAKAAETSAGVVDLACALIAQRAIRFAMEARLLAVRFVLWIFEKQQQKGDYHMDYPKASLLLCAYILSQNRTEAMLEKANMAFRAELAAVGPPLDKLGIGIALEEAAVINPSLDPQHVLEQIGEAAPSHETSVKIFKSVLDQSQLDATKVAMLNPTRRSNADASPNH